jgi:pimeloyl-ACP methyl ester carboxylesterase
MTESSLNRRAEPILEKSQLVEQPIQAVIQQSQAIKQIGHALKDIYFVSGLGADERVFRLLKFEGYQPVHLRWLDPKPKEPIADYAKRLAAQIKADRPVIVGLSFGGMIAVEIAKQIEVEKVILISSVRSRAEIPPYFKLFRWLPLHRIFPFKTLLWAEYWFADWVFGIDTPDECRLLRAILQDTDAHFLKWALHQVVIWKNETIPDHLYHLHGSSDRIFPICYVQPDVAIERGGHFMIVNRAAQISALLEKIIG